MKEEDIGDNTGNDALRNSQFCTSSEDRYFTSPADDAKPDKHLAAKRLVNVVALAVQMSIAKSINVAKTRDARFPNLTPNGTQK
jgi:hypothetical protein